MKISGEMRFKKGNIYSHLNIHCIRAKQPSFSPQMAIVSEETAPYLTQAHSHCLREFGLNLPLILKSVV